jgi:hypothetical protein
MDAMPSAFAAPSAPALPPASHAPAQASASPAQQLAQAHGALWLATLSLMTAFMQTPAPAHRYLLARRIGRNLDTLARGDCFDSGSRATFARLSSRWSARAEQFAPREEAVGKGLLGFLL